MLTTNAGAAHRADDLRSDLDALLDRVIKHDTDTEVGMTRRLATIAEEHYMRYEEVRTHLEQRFNIYQVKVSCLSPEAREKAEREIAAIPTALHRFLGITTNSRK